MNKPKYGLLEELRKDPLMKELLGDDGLAERRMWRLGNMLEMAGYPSSPAHLLDLILIGLNSAYEFSNLQEIHESGILPIIQKAVETVERKASWKRSN